MKTSQASTSALPRTGRAGAIFWTVAKSAIAGQPRELIAKLHRPQILEQITKANEIGAANTGGSGGELESSENAMAQAGAAALLMTAIGRMPAAIRIPLQATVAGLLAEPTAFTHTEGGALKATSATFQAVTLVRKLRAVLWVVTDELLQLSNADRILASVGLRAVAREINAALFSPSRVGSLSYGHSSVAGGDTYADADFDFQELLSAVTNANQETLVWVAAPNVITGLAGTRTAFGNLAYPTVNVKDGGFLLGLPIIPAPGLADGELVLVDSAEVLYGAENVTVEVARSATVELSSAPTGDSVTPTGMTQQAVSLFQAGATALKIGQPINAAMRRPACVAALTGFNPADAITT